MNNQARLAMISNKLQNISNSQHHPSPRGVEDIDKRLSNLERTIEESHDSDLRAIHSLRSQISKAQQELEREHQQREEPVSYTHLRAHETPEHLVCRLLLEKKK